MIRRLITWTMIFAAFSAMAAEVHVAEQTLRDGVIEPLRERTLYTGSTYETVTAPKYTGYIFTHWSSTDSQGLDNRDVFGRARDVARFMLYDNTTLTANYIGDTVDEDQDGVPDGYEWYWYGDLNQTPEDDTDGDGMTFAQEIAAGSNPLMPNKQIAGVVYKDSDEFLYNPNGYAPYVFRSEPEDQLFLTQTGYKKPGTVITTPSCSHLSSAFAYWMVDGERQSDVLGRAKDSFSFVMPTGGVEAVAIVEDNATKREQYYWYGREQSLESDTDGDGMTFAEEIAAGSNPLMPNRQIAGVVYKDSDEFLYNPEGYAPYIFRSEPEDQLFLTQTGYKKPGTVITTPSCSHLSSAFSYWMVDGERQSDVFGRAKDSLSFVMTVGGVEAVAIAEENDTKREQYYWYGREQSLESDTDGDGMTFAQEIAAGSNPLMPNRQLAGVVCADSPDHEMNLQLYEQPTGVLVGERYVDFFSSPTAGKDGRIFAGGAAIWPVVGDANGDGLWDLVVVSAGETNLFLNVGTKGNPKFVEESLDVWGLGGLDVWMNSTEKLAGMSFDVEPVGALSATTNGATMLVSDEGGRIWYYVRGVEDVAPYQLQHKVWGGSFDGFAKGLMLAAVDWEDDGDVDCICGTAEGKLMLLRDPKAGRPTGLEALAGVDNVKLDWDPNEQPRVKGYKVYRNEVEKVGGEWSVVAQTSLPTYRDWPGVIQDYQYRVTSLSRFYVAGSSTPVENESVPSDAVRAELGKVRFLWTDAAGFVGQEIPVSLGVENSLNLSGNGLKLVVAYDAEKLEPVRVEKSGLTTGVTFTESAEGGVWTLQASGGTIEPGGGTLFTFVFKGLEEAEAARVSLTSATLKSVGGADVPAVMPSEDAQVAVEEMKPAYADIVLTESVVVKSGDSFRVEVSAAGERIDATTLTYDFVYDRDYFSRNGNTFAAADVGEKVTSVITVTNVSVKATDGREAKIASVGQCAVSLFPQGGEEGGHQASMKVKDVWGDTGETVAVPIGIRSDTLFFRDTTLDISGWEFEVGYGGDVLEYVGYEAEAGAYACKAEEDCFGSYVSVKGKSGSLKLGRAIDGWKYPIKLLFKIKRQFRIKSAMLDFGYVTARATDGEHIYTPLRWSGEVHIHFVRSEKDPTTVVPYARGDVNGDGVLSKEDEQLLSRLMNGGKKTKWTKDELRAGDYNGNGKLDQGDYQLMKDDFKERGIK